MAEVSKGLLNEALTRLRDVCHIDLGEEAANVQTLDQFLSLLVPALGADRGQQSAEVGTTMSLVANLARPTAARSGQYNLGTDLDELQDVAADIEKRARRVSNR